MKKLTEKLIETALSSSELREELKKASVEIVSHAKSAPNEKTIEGIFERILYALLKEINITFHPEKEVFVRDQSRRHVGKGRVDSRIRAVVIEYKHRSKLAANKDIEKAKQQLASYISSLSANLKNEIIGFLTDGIYLYELRAIDGEMVSTSGRLSINEKSLLTVIRSVVALNQSALTAKNLIRDFCGKQYDGAVFEVARILNSILLQKSTPKTAMLWSEWEELFRLAHEDQSQQKRIEERRKILSEIFQENLQDAATEYRALFALHTSYAIVLKLMAYRIVSDIEFDKPLQNYAALLRADDAVLRSFCADLEDGEIFRKLGILNLLEGDFFSWYCDSNQWNSQLTAALKNILEILGRYESITKIFERTSAIDLFRELYEATVPQVVRASFGEFYTPFWLAQHVLKSSDIKHKNWRALDPCCGSGTFVIAAISQIRKGKNRFIRRHPLLMQILQRVAALDLNPLAVLTTRIHYFIHISDLLTGRMKNIVIPVFLGDASYVPEKVKIDGVLCLSYSLRTLKDPISIELPIGLVKNTAQFVQIMYKYEQLVKKQASKEAADLLIKAINKRDRKPAIKTKIIALTDRLIDLEKRKWNGIWARIITNFMISACLRSFTNIIGNPPWIDWKNLPAGYREKVKSLCVDKGLFSGAGRTGGINLNICALITHVAATNWLSKDGRLAFLMPKELAYQASYEGWRKAVGGLHRDIIEFHDWSKVGYPFDPVKEDFMTYVIGPYHAKMRHSQIVPAMQYIKKVFCKTHAHEWADIETALDNLDIKNRVAGQIIENSTIYTFAADEDELRKFKKIARECAYIGREGIEFYPQELLIFKYIKRGPKKNTVFLENLQITKAKYKIPKRDILLETKYLYPLVKGAAIEPFNHRYEGLITPFPYEAPDSRRPIDAQMLEQQSPLLLEYYNKHKETIQKQTKFSDKIRGLNSGEFYGLARTGQYSFQNVFVAFRDNTKWCAAVIESQRLPWNEVKRFVFQNHAVSMCERSDGSGYISKKEAHYICAILNAPIVEKFIHASSDTRSFKIRPPIYIPRFNARDKKHVKLARLSKKLHSSKKNLSAKLIEIEKIYLSICQANFKKRVKLVK